MIVPIVKKIINDNGGIYRFKCYVMLHQKHNACNYTWKECEINQLLFTLNDRQTITLKPCNGIDTIVYTSKTFTYQEFYGSIKTGTIIVKTNHFQHIDRVKWLEPLCTNVCLVHEADIVVGRSKYYA